MAKNLSWDELAKRAGGRRPKTIEEVVEHEMENLKHLIDAAMNRKQRSIFVQYPIGYQGKFLDTLNEKLPKPFFATDCSTNEGEGYSLCW